jgi:hypothetical protein
MKGRLRKLLFTAALAFSLPAAAMAQSGPISFVGRTENNTNSANTSVTVSAPAGIQPGDIFVVTVNGWQSYPSNTPSGLAYLGSVQDVRQYGPDYLMAFEGIYTSGGPSAFQFNHVNYPKAVLRAYRGVQGVDATAFSSTSGPGTHLSLPALPPTAGPGDWYVGFYTTDTQPPTCPSDLGDGNTDGVQWQTCDGDKVIPNQGTSPGAETASSASNTDWIGFDIDLISLPLGTSTPPATTTSASPVGAPTPAAAATPIADTDSSFIFSRTPVPSTGWLTGTDVTYSDGCVYPPQSGITVQGPMAAINFVGTGITLYGQTGPNFGIGAYALDGGVLTTVDAYSATGAFPTPLVTLSGLADESHVLSYQVTCNKNAGSSAFYQALADYQVDGSRNPFSNATQYSYAAGNVTLNGSGWTCGEPPGNPSTSTDLSGDHCWDGNAGDSVEWTFTGSLIEVFIRPDVGDGYFDVQIDGTTVASKVNGQYTIVDNDQLDAWMAFAQSGLSSGSHTIKLIVDGDAAYPNESEDSGQTNLLQFDVGLAFP